MLGLATTNLCTKFEISTLTHYKDMKGDENAKKCIGGLGVKPAFHDADTNTDILAMILADTYVRRRAISVASSTS